MSPVTQTLESIAQSDRQAADELLPLVYGELRKLAAAKISRESPNQTLQPTALVHEAWLRLAGDQPPRFDGRGHFFAAAAEAMRRILIDKARRKSALRHGGDQQRMDIDDLQIALPAKDDELIAMNDALNKLAVVHPIQAEVVKLRYFVGLTNVETAQALRLSERTVKNHWAHARAWLFREIQSQR
jgi:RNA polymerase sigma factor (TIGR02999 family)